MDNIDISRARIELREKEEKIRNYVAYIAQFIKAETYQYSIHEYYNGIIEIRVPKKSFIIAKKLKLFHPSVNILKLKE